MKITLLMFALLLPFTLTAQKRQPIQNHNSSPAVPSANRFGGLDTTFARVLNDWKAAGFAVAVVEKGSVVYAKGFGYRDVDKKLPVTPNTLFAIGSCTKAFTASLLGLLRKDGKVEFDHPITTYLPYLKFYNDDLTAHVTLRDLMCHRTGLPRHDFSWYGNNTTRDSLVSRLQYMEPANPLRKQFEYNNFMFLLQGVVAEKLTGKSWETNIRERILEPLDMNSTFFSIDDLTKSQDAALGYEVWKDSLIRKTDYFHIDGMGPAGSINSSVLDMAKWVSIWMKGGKSGDKEILPASYVREAMTSQIVAAGVLPTKEKPDLHLGNYGLGWSISSYKGHYRVEHGGAIDGFTASTCFFPSDSIGIIVLANQDGSSLPPIVRNILADRILNLPLYDWNKDMLQAVNKAKAAAKATQTKNSSARKTGTKPSHPLANYAGRYQHPGYGIYTILAKDDSLFLKTPTLTWWLSHYHYDTFQPFDTKGGIDTTDITNSLTDLRLQFTTNVAGDLDGLAITGIEPSLPKPLLFNKRTQTQAIAVADLKQYEGEYDLAGTILTVTIRDGKTLYLNVPGQPDYELAFSGSHAFIIKQLSGYSVQYEVNKPGNVVALTLIQPNGRFKATRKQAKPVAEMKR